MSESELRSRDVARLEALEELLCVEADTADELEGSLGGIAGYVEGGLDAACELPVGDAEDDGRLFRGEVELEERLEVLVDDACANDGRLISPENSWTASYENCGEPTL